MRDAHRDILKSPQNHSIEAVTKRHNLKTGHFLPNLDNDI